ncbi:PREDICTED: protein DETOXIFICATION 51-like [Tarenaya hassleriana]|uniref:protein DETOXIFICATION 51-like n=1 Tax=Tarenaya hassleriana TaxID=28532 RepID=UPI00053C8FE7|nr:PREDICTED: protein DETOXIFICATION 51-like [Tarenaya hassleriana]
MCNPSSAAVSSISDKQQPESPQTHIFLDLFSIKTIQNPDSDMPNPLHPPVPFLSDALSEAKSLFALAFPIAVTALVLYLRSVVSMLFLGRLGDLELAAGSFAIAFANITGYSVLSGLALGMEPLCSQAFGAHRFKLLSITLHRTVVFLLLCSVPISVLWLNVGRISVYLHQDPDIARLAQIYLLFSLSDLFTNSFVHPIRIYLRAQGIIHPVTVASLAGAVFHLPANFFLVSYLRLGLAGVSLASAFSNFFVLCCLVCYVWARGLHAPTWTDPTTRDCFSGWQPLLRLAGPSCISVCLEWWWYEIMIVLCGLLVNPRSTVAAMGVLIQTTSLLYVFPSSLGFAVSTRVGNELGANRPRTAKLASMVAVAAAAAMGLTASAFACGVRNSWGRMFTADADILRLTASALPLLGLCEIGNCPQTVSCGVVRGTARPSTAANVNLGAFYLVGMPVAIGLGFWAGFGFNGLWLGLFAAQVSCAGLMMYVVGSTDWDKEAEKAQSLTCTGGIESVTAVTNTSKSTVDDGESDEAEPLIRITVLY